MEIDIIAQKLIDLTARLSSQSPEDEQQMVTLRRVMGYNLRNNRQDIPVFKPQSNTLVFAPSKEKIQEFKKYVVTNLTQHDKYLVERIGGKAIIPVIEVQTSTIRLPFNPFETALEVRWNQKVSEQVGPFFSEEGRSIWFNLHYYEDKLTVRSQSDTIPYFLFSKAIRNQWEDSFLHAKNISLKAGHVWISGKLLSDLAGSGDYVGFIIKGGSFSLLNEKIWNGQFLDFKGDFTGHLTMQLVQPPPNSPSFEGCKGAQTIDFQYPDEVTFNWKNGKLTDITAGDGHFDGYGNHLMFTQFTTPAAYQAGLNHVLIPCQVAPTTWQANYADSAIFDATGKADIGAVYWALPLSKVSDPSTLGEPENNGGWGLRISMGITATWIGVDKWQPTAVVTDAWLLLYPVAQLFYSEKTTVDTAFTRLINQAFVCWHISADNAARIPLSFQYQDVFPLIYYCHATDGEALLLGCSGGIQADRPVFAEGSHMELMDMKGWVSFQAKGPDIHIGALLGNSEALHKTPKPIALANALMVVSQPAELILSGALSLHNLTQIEQGQITLLHGLLRWKPTLPDPYVSNTRPGWDRKNRGTQFSSAVFTQVSWQQPDKPVVTVKGGLTLSTGVSSKPSSDPTIKSLPGSLNGSTLENIKKNRIDGTKREKKVKADKVLTRLDKQLTGWKLLDVSTNMDLIGVYIGPSPFQTSDRSAVAAMVSSPPRTGDAFVVKEMAVNTPLSLVHVFTVPQVQWEPVRTLPEDQNVAALGWFPEYLGSASDGGPTRLFGLTSELSPIIPDVVIRQIQENFTKGNQTIALTTLSFGLKAAIALRPQHSPTHNADSLTIQQPEFPQKQLKGGIQLNMMAESGHPKSESRSPGFEGFMVQTLNGYELFTGIELGLSVLGATLQPEASVETQFNDEFAPGGTAQIVPVTRFDLSGYGASNFSEWDNPGAVASVGKVQFKIMVGRTAFEVVKFVSKIYPWGTTVTRSVTIERRSGGGVIRKDSGWQATQAGIFDFRVPTQIPDNPFTFCPGLFRGCFDLKNIRPASNDIIQFADPANGNAVELAPVYFDANVQLDGQGDAPVFSRGVLGFIQLQPKPDTSGNPWTPRLLSEAAFRKLITDQGAIGGPIDTILNVGNSGFRFRATRFEVDVTDNAGEPNFIGVVRGQPALPSNGSWSTVKMAAPGNVADPQEATSAGVSRGTPLLIENVWNPPTGNKMNVSGPTGPYRFIDAVDLFVLQPRFDYGFMQNTGSQAFLFRRPEIALGTNELSSTLKPAFADPFALLTSKGVFPPIANAIELPTTDYKLLIQSGTGKLRLNRAINFSNLRPPLIVTQDGTDQVAIEYDQSQLKMTINEDDWQVELDNFFVWTSLMGISKFTGTRFSLRAGNSQQAKLVDVLALLKPEIQDALSFLPGMGSPSPIGDIDLGMTNGKHEVKVHTGYKTKNLIPKPLDDRIELKLSASAGVDSESDTSTGVWKAIFSATAGAELQGKIPILGGGGGGTGLEAFVILGLELEAGLQSGVSPTVSGSSATNFKSLDIAAYVGIGVSGRIAGFKAEAFIAAGLVFVYEDNTAKFGGIVKLDAEVDLKIVNVEITAELKGVYYRGDDPDTPTVESNVSLIDASGEVAINVSICFVINISVSYAYQTTVKP